MSDDQRSQIKALISRGKEQGYLTYAEVNDHLPDDIVAPEQIDDIINMINDLGIGVHEQAPDAETLLLSDNAVSDDDDSDAEEAAAALASADSDFGRTTDPVRMYMREMGTVELLTRQGEIRIAMRIEEGQAEVLKALASFPGVIEQFIKTYDETVANGTRLTDVVAGFIDPSQLADELTDEQEGGYAVAGAEVVIAGLGHYRTNKRGYARFYLPQLEWYALVIRHGDHEEVLYEEKMAPGGAYVYRPDPESTGKRLSVLSRE